LRDSISRGEAPIASHLLFTQPGVLDDTNPVERAKGIDAGLAWYRVAERCVVYTDRGISPGMTMGMSRAKHFNVLIEFRTLADVENAA
jgi:hypothetical protein